MFSMDDAAYVLKIDEVTQNSYDIVKIKNDLSYEKYGTLSSEDSTLFCENMIPSLDYKGHLINILVICYDYEF